jgi:outer membrane PBP1 activator LpoA protein
MLAKSVKLLLLGAIGGLVAGCSTPCGVPGSPCAPILSDSGTAPRPVPAAPAPRQAEAPPPAAETFAVTLPGTSPDSAANPDNNALPATPPVRMALLLPLKSETLGPASDSLRAGFMAAWERDRDNIAVTVIETGDVAQDVLSSYAAAEEQNDIVVGPLARSAVAAVAGSALVNKPTIALNYPEGYGMPGSQPLPPQMLAMGLSIEEEARQAAQWASVDHPHGSALILTTSTPWQRRIAAAFAAQWQRYALSSRTVELSNQSGYLSDPELVQLRARIQADPPSLIFAALGADQTRQLRNALVNVLPEMANGTQPASGLPPGSTEQVPGALTGAQAIAQANILPIYGTSSLNPGSGSNSPTQELDGVRLLDLPWQLQRDHPAVMVYPRPVQAGERKPGAADMERLYALGIDAYRVAREISRHPVARFHLDGVTGRLTISFGQGEASFERQEQPARYQNGVAQAVSTP